MPTIEQTYIIQGSPEDVWDALINPERIQVWSGAPAEFMPEPGAEYWLWDGDIRGKILEADANQRLVQTWKPRKWDVENSVVTFLLTPTEAGTRVDLVHENVQEWDYEDTAEGWDIYYLGAIKKMIEGSSSGRTQVPEVHAQQKRAKPTRASAARKRAAPKRKSPAKKTAPKKASKAAKKSAAKKGSKRKK